ncbi:MAG: hypothetical protein ACI4PG_08580 [Candidatus Ventricola sp.]
MKAFKRFYVWGMCVKRNMGIYFSALVFFCGLIAVCRGQDALSLLSLLEILLLCFAIAALQSFLLPEGTDYSGGVFFGRAMLWAGLSSLSIFAACLLGGWLAMPGWLPSLLLAAAMFAGLLAMLIGERFKQEIETEQLNEGLARRRRAGQA